MGDVHKNLQVFEKTTKRPLLLSKRVMTLGMIERTQSKEVPCLLPQHQIHKIPKGTLINALVNVRLTHDLSKMKSNQKQYVAAFQDFIAWFLEAEGGSATILVVVMRVDMGIDMPRFPFLATVATVGVISMNRLAKIANISKK
jgi:hypothetical protein